MMNDGGQWRLWDAYLVAVEEYRFVVQLNWQRTQYLLGLNTAVLGGAVGLLNLEGAGQNGWPTAAVFLVGMALAMFGLIVHATQHSYYRAARDKVVRIGSDLNLGPYRLDTTRGMSPGDEDGRFWQPPRVKSVLALVFVLFLALHVVGLVWLALGPEGLDENETDQDPVPPVSQTEGSKGANGQGAPPNT